MNNKYKYYYICNYFYFSFFKGLTKVYTISDIKQIRDIPQGTFVIKGDYLNIIIIVCTIIIF